MENGKKKYQKTKNSTYDFGEKFCILPVSKVYKFTKHDADSVKSSKKEEKMNKKRKGARRWTALALSVAMVFSGIGILPAPVKAEAADVAAAVQKTGATTERSERKMKFGDDWKFKLVNKYNINDTSVQADGVDYDDSSWDNVDLPHDWAIYGT